MLHPKANIGNIHTVARSYAQDGREAKGGRRHSVVSHKQAVENCSCFPKGYNNRSLLIFPLLASSKASKAVALRCGMYVRYGILLKQCANVWFAVETTKQTRYHTRFVGFLANS